MDKPSICCALALSLANAACSELTIIGVSGEQEQASETLSMSAPLRVATEIGAIHDELLQPYTPELGDIDGDGYDDFILGGSALNGAKLDRDGRLVTPDGDPATPAMTAYLFYGRPSLPEKLLSSDADASFEAGNYTAFSIGDVNGDGLQDFALTHKDGYQIVFGSSERLAGHYAKFTTGTVVTYPAEEDEIAGGPRSAIDTLSKLGDINGDGKDEFLVRVIAPDAVSGNAYGIGVTDYIVEGRADGWPTGPWDSSFAVAELGQYQITNTTIMSKLASWYSGDIDGDGFHDILTMDYDSTLVFYGKPEGLHGSLVPDRADADLDFGPTAFPYVIGDLDGDGAGDIGFINQTDIRIVYGGNRYSGVVTPPADLVITGKDLYTNILVADINGDGKRDLLFGANADDSGFDDTGFPTGPVKIELYEMRGNGKRLTGEIRGTNTIFQTVGYTAPAALRNGGGFNVSAGGDIDGDGSTDLVLGVAKEPDLASSTVYILPGSMNIPE